MITFSIDDFKTVGMTPGLAQHLYRQAMPSHPDGALLRVTAIHRETLTLHDGRQEHSARALPRLQREMLDLQTALNVGDWVLSTQDTQGALWVVHRLEPLTTLARKDADGHHHTVVSNVDTAFLVMGLDADFNPQRLERYLALVQGNGVLAVVVLTKADGAPDLAEARVAELRGRLGNALDIVAVDGRSPEAIVALQPYLGLGQTVVMLGSSGAGKSTLTNTLLGHQRQDTGAVRVHDSRGKHTTTARTLHCLAGGACVIDTPGVRTLSPGVDAATLAQVFDDIGLLSQQCRFRDCQHGDEPGCAVRAGIHPGRLKNYQKLLRESQRDQRTVFERQAQLAVWKARSKAARAKNKRASDWSP
jgi:ribosome biogenesis GTPase